MAPISMMSLGMWLTSSSDGDHFGVGSAAFTRLRVSISAKNVRCRSETPIGSLSDSCNVVAIADVGDFPGNCDGKIVDILNDDDEMTVVSRRLLRSNKL